MLRIYLTVSNVRIVRSKSVQYSVQRQLILGRMVKINVVRICPGHVDRDYVAHVFGDRFPKHLSVQVRAVLVF